MIRFAAQNRIKTVGMRGKATGLNLNEEIGDKRMVAGLPVDKIVAFILLWMAPTAPPPQKVFIREEVPQVQQQQNLSDLPEPQKVLGRMTWQELQGSQAVSRSA